VNDEVTTMKKALCLAFLMFSALSWSTAGAADRASLEEAKAMALKTVEYLKENGPEKTFAAVSAKGGPFHDRDLYVTIFDSRDGKMVNVANGNNPSFIGKDVIEIADVDGYKFGRAYAAVKDEGWVSYKWQDPLTKAVVKKKTFIVRVGDYVIGCGAYAEAR
jgi:cytochrome c